MAWCAAVELDVVAAVVLAVDDDAAAALLLLVVLVSLDELLLPHAASRAATPMGTSAKTGFMSNSPLTNLRRRRARRGCPPS